MEAVAVVGVVVEHPKPDAVRLSSSSACIERFLTSSKVRETCITARYAVFSRCFACATLRPRHHSCMTQNYQKMLILDGSNLCHRSYHALAGAGLRDADGNAVWAMHGMLGLIGKFVADVGATHVVVCRDLPGGCPDRKNAIPEYKAHRSAPEPDLRVQLDRYPVLLEELGVAHVAVDGVEADDLLASVAAEAERRGMHSVIVTSDRDAYQLLRPGVDVVRPEGVIVSNATIQAKYGVEAHEYAKLAALVGEPGDGISGLPRVGAKTAAKLINHFKDELEGALSDHARLRECVSESVAKLIVENAHIYSRNLRVAKLRDDLDMSAVVAASNVDSWSADHVQSVCRNWGLPRAGAALWAGVGETAPF